MTGTARVLRAVILVSAMVLATYAVGWTGVLMVAIGFAIIDRRASVPGETALAAGAAWGALLFVHVVEWSPGARRESMPETIAQAMGLPVLVPPIVTVVFPALLAWAAATVTVAVLHRAGRPRSAGPAAARDP